MWHYDDSVRLGQFCVWMLYVASSQSCKMVGNKNLIYSNLRLTALSGGYCPWLKTRFP